MKLNLEKSLRWLREGAVRVMRSYPVEMLLALYACVGCLLTYELNWGDEALSRLGLVPLFFALALAVNGLAGRGPWRKIYWVVWLPLIPLSFWNGLETWVERAPYRISLGILAPLAVLASLRAVRNDRFVNDAIVWLRAGVLALLFSNVALGLFYAIFYSTVYIFGLDGPWTTHVAIYAVTITETLVVPALFLMLSDRWRGAAFRGNRMIGMLLDYTVTPALVIYAAILYLYMAKILVTWSLPEGGVAYLVFGFTIAALAVKALQQLTSKRMYDWFYDRLSLVTLPMLVLFWIGVARRTGEYALTEPRVYLWVCGALMTLCVVLFLSRRTGRYLWVCLFGLALFAVLAFVPALEPGRVAVRSQVRRAERLAGQLERLDADGRLRLTPLPLADTVYKKAYRNLYESLQYVRRDSAAFARFGVADLADFAAIFPECMRSYVQRGVDDPDVTDLDESIEMPRNAQFEVVADYSRYCTNVGGWGTDGYRIKDDTLQLYLGQVQPVVSIPTAELLGTQLERSGFDPAKNTVPTDEQRLRLLDYRGRECRILFNRLDLVRTDSVPSLTDVSINSVWMR